MVTSSIEVKELSKWYGKQQVLHSLNINMSNGECIGLMGPNGSGKTTLIKSLVGLVKPTSGEIFVNKKEISKSYKYRSIIGYMPQINHFPEQMKVWDLFQLMKKIRLQLDTSITFDTELYDLFNISDMHDKTLNTLSGGMRQKVSASLAFMFNPEILILDEPTAALDPISNDCFKQKIRSCVSEGKLILITSHIMSELDEMVSRIVYLMGGCIQIDESRRDLKSSFPNVSLNKAIVQVLKNSEL